MREFLKDYIQGISECMTLDKADSVELTEEELNKAIEEMMNSKVWNMVDEEVIQTIAEIVNKRGE